jgi:galactokinase/mevalonate kinase-like predicted kinase
VRYLPETLLGDAYANQTLLLYYTGVTRLAKGILKEIVHDMFLARSSTLRTLGLIRANAQHLHSALQQGDRASLHRCVARSWDLNRRLDPGTTTPQIERVIRLAGAGLAACKLLGAGGGGYMLLCAETPEAGRRIRAALEERPLNSRARFIDFRVSSRAVEVTVS